MTATLISLISVIVGILGANLTGTIFKKFTFGLVGNTITGVFGSVLLIKSFGRLGFDPVSVMESGNTNWLLFFLHIVTSFIGGVLSIFLMKKLQNTMESNRLNNNKMVGVFKVISFLEGVSYILLLFIGVPLKYFLGNDILVKTLGMPHGLLFLAYIILALVIRSKMKWSPKTTFIVLILSLVPFGTFYVNRKYLYE